MKILLGLCFMAATALGHTLLEAVAEVESSGGRYLVGDNGRARGAWQMHRRAWADVNGSLPKAARKDYQEVRNPITAKQFAQRYLAILEKEMRLDGVLVTARHLYAAYNLGLENFRLRGYDLRRCPVTTRRQAERVFDLTVGRRAQ